MSATESRWSQRRKNLGFYEPRGSMVLTSEDLSCATVLINIA
jgi:hypothetical protein